MSSTTHGNTKPSPNQEIKPHILHNRVVEDYGTIHGIINYLIK